MARVMSLILFVISLLLMWSHSSFSQLCNNRVAANQFLANPSPFRGITTLQPSSSCSTLQSGLSCLYSVILGDNDPVPLQPNLDGESNTNDIGKFLVWPSDTNTPYITFAGVRSATAINIQFLNYPAQGFSLPNLQLYSTTSVFVTDPNNPNVQRLEFDLRNNNVLSQEDNQVTSISLVFSGASNNDLLLHWDYTGVYNIRFFMVSEVDFCTDTQPPGDTQVTFQDPQSDNSVIIPTVTVEELTITKSTTINCTVSSSGLFEWRWKQNQSMIANNGKFSIFTADGTRTSILQLTGLGVSDAAKYTCEVRRNGRGEFMSRTQALSFPVIVDLPGQVTGYLDEGQVKLTCVVYGFLRSVNPPTWLDSFGNSIDTSCPLKYKVIHTTISALASQPSILISNGSRVPSLRSTLTIRQLEEGDEGQYTCMVEGNSTTITLHIQRRSITASESVTSTLTSTECSCTQSAVVASFVSSIITTVITIGISINIYIGVWFCRKPYSNEADQDKSNDGVYETVDDKHDTTISIKRNEAYGTTIL